MADGQDTDMGELLGELDWEAPSPERAHGADVSSLADALSTVAVAAPSDDDDQGASLARKRDDIPSASGGAGSSEGGAPSGPSDSKKPRLSWERVDGLYEMLQDARDELCRWQGGGAALWQLDHIEKLVGEMFPDGEENLSDEQELFLMEEARLIRRFLVTAEREAKKKQLIASWLRNDVGLGHVDLPAPIRGRPPRPFIPFKVGDRVEAICGGRGQWYYPGYITAVSEEGDHCDIEFDDGEEDSDLRVKFIRHLDPCYESEPEVDDEACPPSESETDDDLPSESEQSEFAPSESEQSEDYEEEGSDWEDREEAATAEAASTQKKKGGWKLRSWEESYDLLCAFEETNDHCNVPQGYAEDPRLANWVKTQRQEYKKGTLDDDRVTKLNDIGFAWVLNEIREWDDSYVLLCEYKATYGDCNVPQGYEEDPQLARWVNTQRTKYKRGTLNDYRVKKLNDIKFEWDMKKGGKGEQPRSWEESYDLLCEYEATYGDCNVPRGYAENPQLARWVDTQRQQYKKDKLDADRVKKLNDLKFEWVLNEIREWDDSYALLCEYKATYGDCNVPKECEEDPQLARWVSAQRQQYKKGKLNDYRVKKLNDIKFEWVLQERRSWEESYDLLCEYEATYGDCNVPRGYAENPQLARWVSAQRQQYKKDKLDADRVKKLNAIRFAWVWRNPDHVAAVATIRVFVEEQRRGGHPHCHLPHPSVTKCPELQQLWPFVITVRKKWREGTLVDWIKDELNDLGFEFDPPRRRVRKQRVETKMTFNIGAEHGLVVNVWDRTVSTDSNCRPDTLFITTHEGKTTVTDGEWSEHRHDGETIQSEQEKMNDFIDDANRRGWHSINIIHANTAERKEIDPRQQRTLAKLLRHIHSTSPPGVHVWYVDFPDDHFHVRASRARLVDDPLGTSDWNYPIFNDVHQSDKWNSGCVPGM